MLRHRHFVLYLALAFLAYLLYRMDGYGIPNIYQARDLHRALDILEGKWIWYGPDMTGGGRLPGPFYYWLLAIPLAISNSLESPQLLLAIINAIASVMLFRLLEKSFSIAVAFAGYLLFLHSPVIGQSIGNYWNPSFILPFFILTIGALMEPEALTKPRRLIVAGVTLGLAAQIHMTSGLFIFAIIVGLVRYPFPTRKERLRALAIFAVATFAPMIPFYLWRISDSSADIIFNRSTDGGKHLVFPFYKYVAYWDHFGQVFKDNLYLGAKVVIGPEPFSIAALLGLIYFRRNPFAGRPLLTTMFVVTAVMLPWFVFDIGRFRYVAPFFLLAIMAAAIALGRISENVPKRFSYGLLAFAFTFTIGKLFLVNPYTANEPILRDSGMRDPKVWEMKGLMSAVAEATAWPYETARERMIFVGIDRETDLSIVYDRELAKIRESGAKSNASIDGVVIVPTDRRPSINFEDFLLFLERTATSFPEVIDGFRTGSVVCVEVKRIFGYAICLYAFKNRDSHELWNNIGYSYRYYEPPAVTSRERSGVVSTSLNEALFYVNGCAHAEPSCFAYFKVTLSDKKLRLRAFGDPIGAPDQAVNPAFVLTLDDAKLNVTCEGNRIEWTFAHQLGSHRYRDAFLAPFETVREIPCANPSSIELALRDGREVTSSKPIPHPFAPYRLTWTRTP